ncbi:MAG: hypothetical protein ACREEB_01585 [Caulobacteraceae bacterium]
MKAGRTAALVCGVAAAGMAASAPSARQVVTGPVAVYWMSAATTSGMAGMMGGGRPSMASILAMRNGGGAGYSHTLVLQLGSSQRAADPTAEHDPPQALGVGPVLPLVTPAPSTPAVHEETQPGPPPQFRQPHGRMLIFWGCGEHAPPGQPLVIDFAQAAKGQMPPQFAALMHGLAVRPMEPPSAARNATYGEWPNRDSRTSVPANGSLQGDHFIHGNYSPDIHFSLTANQDFLPPFVLTANQKNDSGSATLAWRPIDGARGYFGAMFGAQGQGDVVMWTSSASQTFAFALPDYLSDGEIDRLVASHALLDASTTSCVVPEEAVRAAGRAGFFMLNAYGGETNISYPPRPPAPRPWHIAWQVKIRYKSSTSGLLGMDMSQMMGSRQDDQDQQQPPQQQPHHHSFFNPLGSLIPH